MITHTVTTKAAVDTEERNERGALFDNAGEIYIMAQVGKDEYALINLGTGNRFANATSGDPFNRERADFRRIPGNRKITIE